MFTKFHVSLFIVALAAPCWTAVAQNGPSSDERFEKLLDEHWRWTLKNNPLLSTSLGNRNSAGRLPDASISHLHKLAEETSEFVDALDALSLDQLNPANRMNHEILRRLLVDDTQEYRFKSYLIPITNRSGFHMEFAELHKSLPFNTTQDYENYLSQLDQFGQYTDQHIEVLKLGMADKWVLPSVVLQGYEDTIRPHVVADPRKSPTFAPFLKWPDDVPLTVRKTLSERAAKTIQQTVVPAYSRFLEFMVDQYIPASRSTIGASALPGGRSFYRYRVTHYTTLDIEPSEVHELGIREVARIRSDMEAILPKVQFKGSFPEFLTFLRTDPQFYPSNATEYLRETAYILKRMDGELPKLFGTLPRTPYGLKTIPDYIAPKTTTAYYQPPPANGQLAGQYFLNTYNLKSRPLYELEALSLHEAVPGHHLQIALQQELEGLAEFRKHRRFTVFVEGWALYSERLGLEVGFYTDPYSDFGRLSYEMWRACRLVVDTGIHYFGWTRTQAIEYMQQNTALSRHNIVAEVDRYISWPGQALAYKMGELKIRQLRTEAEEALGTDFDIRQFHDAVLRQGSVPIPILEENIRHYIENKKAE
ncbi:MAG: DUF885 domain-containing protein [Planctomycetota bacterium]|nr:DUF885 domain-containing protein [Planctomycetota bacterium]